MKPFRYLNNARGAVAPLVAIMLVVIIVCVAVVVDLGHIHNVKVQLQRAVDAAALAGANQLDGSAGAAQAAKDAAEAVAAANRVDQESVVIVADSLVNLSDANSPHYVELGTWDDEALGSPASTRFVATETSPNAVKVTATRTVNHVFFFFVPATDITADAIAVAKPKFPVLPLAIITCIPADKMVGNPGTVPPANVCGISAFKFTKDTEDTAAWTSLSFNANANDISFYMNDEEGRERFNNVIFGKNIPRNGIENEPPDPGASSFSSSYEGCPDTFPYDYNITCGLGMIAEKELAAPAEFTPPSTPPLTADADGVYQANLPFDPLTAYGINDALPRWYNLNDDDIFDSGDHFTRVWTQDGILLRGSGESLDEYVNRLGSYATCSDTTVSSCNPYGDDRFKTENFIVEPKDQFLKNLKETLNGYEPAYWPDFRKVIKHAGYPKVGIINGSAATVIQAFVGNEDVSDGENLLCTDNDPFPEGETTLRINAPVIFAGACEDWKAISNPSPAHGFTYVGMSRLLLTRVWTNQNDYDCRQDFVQWTSGNGCDSSDYDPPLNGVEFSMVNVGNNILAIEGLTLEPVADDETDQGSILKVYLVE